jgi:imidazolonepropionase-like amidohydrolase
MTIPRPAINGERVSPVTVPYRAFGSGGDAPASRTLVVHADAYFDGEEFARGDATFLIDDGIVEIVLPGRVCGDQLPENWRSAPSLAAAFACPGLAEAHAHLFLDGAQLDPEARKANLARPFADLLAVGRANLQALMAAGITLVRDAGDRHGVNVRMRAESRAALADGRPTPRVRACGPAIRKQGRYGAFMAVEVADAPGAAAAVAALPADVDDCKILLSGVIDFAASTVKGEPQFNDIELAALIAAARARGLPTFAHASGDAALRLAAAAGVGSIEHGFFMPDDLIDVLAAKGTRWVPTWAPVAFMRDRPEFAGLDAAALAGLHHILDLHRRQVARAAAVGVCIVAGSDAGSWGVPAGEGLHRELAFFIACGLPLAATLRAATSVPRRSWGIAGGRIACGEPADLSLYAEDPRRAGISCLSRASAVVVAGNTWTAPRSS